MGGSGGSLSLSLGALAELESRAKEVMREGDTPRKNLFISFAHEDLNEVLAPALGDVQRGFLAHAA